MPPKLETKRITTHALERTIPKGNSRWHTRYNMSDGRLPTNILMRMQFIAKEFDFHLHTLTDEIFDLGLIHQSSSSLQGKRNMLHLLAWHADKGSSNQGLDYILELSRQFRKSCLVSR